MVTNLRRKNLPVLNITLQGQEEGVIVDASEEYPL